MATVSLAMSDTERIITRIIDAGLKGEKDRGSGGAVLFDVANNTVTYLLIDEFNPPNFVDELRAMISEDANTHIFIVNLESDQYHIWKINRGMIPHIIS